MKQLGVIILGYNKSSYTRRCLETLLKSTWRPMEIILVDNGSTDDTPGVAKWFEELAAEARVKFTCLRNEVNLGASTGRNQGLAASSSEYIAFVDNDVIVRSKRWVEKLAEVLERDPKAGIAGPKLVYPAPPHVIQCAGVAVSPTGRIFYRGRGDDRTLPEFNKTEPVQCLISACWLMKRELYEQLGTLDEIYNPVQYEDLDYCYRARELGWQVYYVPTAEMYHCENATTSGSAGINSPYQIIRNGITFKSRWGKMFHHEGGPDDSKWQWAEILPATPDSCENLPLLDC